MPRKTNGIEFEIHPRPTKGEDGKPLLYVRPAKGRKKSFKELEDFCNKYRNLRTGELQMVFDVVIDVVGLWLSDGYRVETPIGSFAPKLKLLGEHTDPKTIHPSFVSSSSILPKASTSILHLESTGIFLTARYPMPRMWLALSMEKWEISDV